MSTFKSIEMVGLKRSNVRGGTELEKINQHLQTYQRTQIGLNYKNWYYLLYLSMI